FPWDCDVPQVSSEEKQALVLQEMRALIGQPTLEAGRYLWKRFSEFVDIAAVAGCFYYYHRNPSEPKGEQKEAFVVFPIEVALSPEGLSKEWIDSQRIRLTEEWGLEPITFGITGNLYSTFEWESLQSLIPSRGQLDEYWCDDNLRLLTERQRFMSFVDIDKKLSDQQLLSISEQLGTPFLVADSTRGHHLLLPLIFDSHLDPSIQDKVYPKIGCVLGMGWEEHRYLWHSLERGMSSVRVTPGLQRPEVPTVSAVVWDGG
ncbi:unnamed protein product, partial [marine sediment metagenome]